MVPPSLNAPRSVHVSTSFRKRFRSAAKRLGSVAVPPSLALPSLVPFYEVRARRRQSRYAVRRFRKIPSREHVYITRVEPRRIFRSQTYCAVFDVRA